MIRVFFASALGLMGLSALFFALGNVFVKFLSPGVLVTEIAFFRFLVGGVVLLALMAPRRMSFRGNRTSMLLVRGVCGTVAFLCVVKSISLIPLSNALVLFYTFPVFAPFLSYLLFREPLSGWEIVLGMVGLVGIYVVLEPGSHPFNWGVVYGLLAGCSAGFTVVLVQKLRETNGPLIISFYFCLVGGIVCFPLFLKDFTMHNREQFLLLVALGLTFLIAQLLMNQGFKFCKASEGAVILMSEVVFTGIAGVVIFQDVVTPRFLAGACLIVASGVGLNLRNRRVRHGEVTDNADGILWRSP